MENFISKNILYLVKKLGCSQDEFGALFELNRGNINQYVKEKTQPKIDTIQRICNHFSITIDDFVNLDLSVKPYDNKTQAAFSVAEPQPNNYSDKDKIIQAQAKTIETLEKHNTTLERLVENLEEKLGNVS
jgi:transcriptional regulator with XRE-family HTH domain